APEPRLLAGGGPAAAVQAGDGCPDGLSVRPEAAGVGAGPERGRYGHAGALRLKGFAIAPRPYAPFQPHIAHAQRWPHRPRQRGTVLPAMVFDPARPRRGR